MRSARIRVGTIALSALAIILLVTSVYQFNVIGDKEDAVVSLTTNLTTTHQVLDTTKTALRSAHIENDQLRADVNAREDTIVELGVKVNNLNRELGRAEEEITELTPAVRRFAAIGVRGDGTGVVIPLEVKLVKGDGSVSVNIKNVDLQTGIQDSVRTAVDVAGDFTGQNLDTKDITISFINEGPTIVTMDGGSAGAAITATMIAVIQNETIRDDVLLTGTIRADGSVGAIGSVQAKADAAKDYGARTFLVPEGQSAGVSGLAVVEVEDIDDVVARLFD